MIRKFGIILQILMLILFSKFTASANNIDQKDPILVEQVTISFVSSKPPFVSGVFASWIQLSGKNSRGIQLEFFVPYEDENQELPAVGDSCQISYIRHSISGNTTSEFKMIHIKNALVVQHISCQFKNI